MSKARAVRRGTFYVCSRCGSVVMHPDTDDEGRYTGAVRVTMEQAQGTRRSPPKLGFVWPPPPPYPPADSFVGLDTSGSSGADLVSVTGLCRPVCHRVTIGAETLRAAFRAYYDAPGYDPSPQVETEDRNLALIVAEARARMSRRTG